MKIVSLILLFAGILSSVALAQGSGGTTGSGTVHCVTKTTSEAKGGEDTICVDGQGGTSVQEVTKIDANGNETPLNRDDSNGHGDYNVTGEGTGKPKIHLHSPANQGDTFRVRFQTPHPATGTGVDFC